MTDPFVRWTSARHEARRAEMELARLSAAVRAHEWVARGTTVPKRPADHALYRRLEEIEGSPDEEGNGSLR